MNRMSYQHVLVNLPLQKNSTPHFGETGENRRRKAGPGGKGRGGAKRLVSETIGTRSFVVQWRKLVLGGGEVSGCNNSFGAEHEFVE